MYIGEDFLLNNRRGRDLYHGYAKNLPIFDFHSHLSVSDLLENRNFTDLTDIWLKENHYKWRLMRAAGVEEKYITGDANNYEKFLHWADTVPKCIGNPMHHWVHMELKKYFGIDSLLTKETAPGIWEISCAQLKEERLRPRQILESSGVKAVCLVEDPAKSLEEYLSIKMDPQISFLALPIFRPDVALDPCNKEFKSWVKKMEVITGSRIQSLEDLESTLEQRCKYFHELGCLTADHAIEAANFTIKDQQKAENAFRMAMEGSHPTHSEEMAYKTEVMLFLGRLYARLGLVMQLHLGAVRNNSSKLYKSLGPDAGCDSVGDSFSARSLISLLEQLSIMGELPKTILFPSNGMDGDKFAAIAGCFNECPVPGKIQFGAPWWFNDNRDGIERYIKTIANQGLLHTSVGMLTDCRCILSLVRHEYFRRVFCNLLGKWSEEGYIPDDLDIQAELVEAVGYNNAVRHFGAVSIAGNGINNEG